MKRRLARLAAELADLFQQELYARRTRAVLEMASALNTIAVAKPKLSTPAIIPNYLESTATPQPAHADFDRLWFDAQTSVIRDSELENDFRKLANMIVAALKKRVSEAEICRWEFRGTVVSPAFVAEMAQRAGLR